MPSRAAPPRGPVAPDARGEALTALSPGQAVIETVGGGGPIDVPALEASLPHPHGLAVDAAGNLYVGTVHGPQSRVSRVDPTGLHTVIAGHGAAGSSGDDGPAAAAGPDAPFGLAVNPSGDRLYIADRHNHRVCSVDLVTGFITTLAGCGTGGFGGDGGSARLAFLHSPTGVAVDGAGSVCIADWGNHSVRRADAATEITGNRYTVTTEVQVPRDRREECEPFVISAEETPAGTLSPGPGSGARTSSTSSGGGPTTPPRPPRRSIWVR